MTTLIFQSLPFYIEMNSDFRITLFIVTGPWLCSFELVEGHGADSMPVGEEFWASVWERCQPSIVRNSSSYWSVAVSLVFKANNYPGFDVLWRYSGTVRDCKFNYEDEHIKGIFWPLGRVILRRKFIKKKTINRTFWPIWQAGRLGSGMGSRLPCESKVHKHTHPTKQKRGELVNLQFQNKHESCCWLSLNWIFFIFWRDNVY